MQLLPPTPSPRYGRVRAKTFVSILANEIWGQTPPHITRYALINQVRTQHLL
jgi:hypothetical protein